MYLTGARISRDNVLARLPDVLGLAGAGRVSPERGVCHVIY